MKQYLKEWLKDWHNRVFLAVILLAFVIRIYYLNINSAVWWDEADYLSSALHWFYDVPYKYNPQRGVLFPLLIGLLFKLGLSESVTKFFVVVLPSVGSVVLTYLLGKQMYNKNVGLIASSIMSVFWVSVFWTPRFSNDFLALFLQLAAIYCFWRGVIKKHSRYFTWFFGLFLGLAFITRAQSVLVGISLFFFLLIIQGLKFLKNKDLWISVLFFLIPFLPYLYWLNKNFGTPLAFSTGYSSQIASASPFGWYVLDFLFQFPLMYSFILLIIGLATLADLVFGFDLLVKRHQSEKVTADVFWVITTLIVLAFFVFWLRGAEDRWVILLSVPIFLFVGKACMLVYESVKKVNMRIAAMLVILIVIGAMYTQFVYAKPLIDAKKDSYVQVKEAALWMKANSNPSDLVYSASGPQNTYYSQRETEGYPPTEEEFLQQIAKRKPKYLSISLFERHSEWVYGFPERNQDKLVAVNAWFADESREQPMLVIYAFKE